MRKVRPPRMRLARAGERTEVFGGDPVTVFNFTASTLTGRAEGRIDIEDDGRTRTADLADENRITGSALTRISVVPVQDTAITARPELTTDAPRTALWTVAGIALVGLALYATLGDLVGG